ncbi:hypothetical protein [Fulmarus glacialis papillomavirus 1]|uniref:Uncharacterized protein n=1 Tax=Fulmarus glacialis papillomavirus 1 TaxID=1463817 RepID=A0A059TAS4_9PAPI|nr:hypothetical protein [Fulmarus glacialis papillomavirus 1]AHV82123.1 hypothetical protein [Fulmarus glacialis papillomavirus 1]
MYATVEQNAEINLKMKLKALKNGLSGPHLINCGGPVKRVIALRMYAIGTH